MKQIADFLPYFYSDCFKLKNKTMQLIYLLGQVYLGLMFFFFIKSARYIGAGFNFKKWKKENFAKVAWSFIGVTLLGMIYFVDPSALAFALKFVGYDMEVGMQATGVGLGIIFGMATREILKRKGKEAIAKHRPPEL